MPSRFLRFALFLSAVLIVFPAHANPARHRSDTILVKPKRGADVAAQHAALRANVERAFPAIGGLQIVKLPPGLPVEQALEHYRRSGRVEYAEPDYELEALATPNDPQFLDGTLWGLNKISAPGAWDVRTSGQPIVVAVIDSGVRYTHEDLAGNMWINTGEIPGNGIDDDGNGYVDDVYGINAINNTGNPNDDNGHGTHVAGTIGAVGNNAKGVVGVAWNVRIMACKFLGSGGSGYTSDAIKCIDYARAKGAKVMNNSWGGSGFSQALRDAIIAARDADIIFVAAAGNSSKNNDTTAMYPATYDVDNIISVAATDSADGLASFSNYGASSVELGAPGVSIYSTYHGGNASYTTLSGTSMAAPHVAGALALVRAQFPTFTYADAIRRVMVTTDEVPALAGKTVTGGRLNLQRAVTPDEVVVMQWNVEKGLGSLANNNSSQARAIARIVNYQQPDVLLLNEVQSASVANNQAALVDWVTNNVSYLGTAPGSSFHVAVSSISDGFNRNAAISRYPIQSATTYDDGLRGVHSFQVQLPGSQTLQVFHAHFKCCGSSSDAATRQANAQFTADLAGNFANSSSLAYIIAGDLNEDEENPQFPLSTTYRPITTVRAGGKVVEFKPTDLNGNAKTISTRTTATRRFDYVLGASNRVNAAWGEVFKTTVWAQYGLYTNAGPDYAVNDSATASDHYPVVVAYSFSKPELRVTAMSITPSIAAPGNLATLTVTVQNTGPVAARDFQVSTWLSRGSAPECGQTGDRTDNISALAAGASVILTNTINVPASPGSYTAWAFADSQCALLENVETNNLASRNYTVAHPDLSVTTLTVSPASGPPGTPATATVTVKNLGSVNAGSFRLDTWFDRPTAPVCGESGIAFQTISSLAPGATLTYSYPFEFGSTFGTRYVRSFADSQCALPETNEGNNQFARSYSVTGPDLRVASITVTPAAGLPGAAATVTVVVTNAGAESASNFRLDTWFDRSAVAACGETGNRSQTIASLAAKASASFSYSFNFPATFGTKYVRAFVDSQCAVPETSETNNQLTKTYVVGGPDLRVISMSVTPTAGLPGTAGTVSVTVTNAGTQPAGSFRLDTWFDRSTVPTCGETGSRSETIASLAAGAKTTFTYSFNFPSAFGTRYARAMVDSQCAVAETSEANNLGVATYVVGGADLRVVALTVTPASGLPGSAASVSVTVTNAGTQAAGSFKLNTWFDRSTAPVCGETGDRTETISSLNPGTSRSFTYSFNMPATFGTKYARAFVDSDCAVTETLETNNQLARTYVVGGPDLRISSITVDPASGPLGTVATMTVTVTNAGTFAATNFRLDSWFDRSATLTCGLTGDRTETIASLAAGAALTFSYTFNYPATFGTKYARAMVDSQCSVQETLETNNMGLRTYSVTGPDLRIAAIDVTPATGVPGTEAVLSVTVTNAGAQAAVSFRLDSWLSRSTGAVCGETGDRTDMIASLAAGSSVTFNYPFTYPATTGTKYARVFVDSQCTVTETLETNNQATKTYSVTSP